MIISNILKLLITPVFILPMAACSQVEDSDSVVFQKQSASSIITNLKNLNVNQSRTGIDNSLELFLKGYKHLQVGDIDKAQRIFVNLQNSSDKQAKEYGEYGLLLTTFETENMPNMKKYLQAIEGVKNRTDWLSKELRNYKIYYYYNTADFEKSEELLDLVSMNEVYNNALLASIKADLYIRKNDLNKAKYFLEELKVDSEYSISIEARLISLTNGNNEAVDYIASKIAEYPNNEYLKLLHNQHLIQFDQKKVIDNAYELGLDTENTYILAHSIELLFSDDIDSKTLERLNALNNKLNNLSVAKRYIDYYLINIALPINDKEMAINLETASEFNPMNYYLLMHKYYVAVDTEAQLDALKKLEKIDPYDSYILFELARFYKNNTMIEELNKVKQRFSDSKRYKTADEIAFINSI